MFKKTLVRILGCALLSYGSGALAFTLILPPAGQAASASNRVTDSTTLRTQVQPITSAVRGQILSHLGSTSSPRKRATKTGGVKLAANAYTSSVSDVGYLAAASSAAAAGGGTGGRNTQALWISGTTNSLENTFSRTAFYGATHNLQVGYDLALRNRYVLGVSVGHEASNFTTTFNDGNEKTRGYNVNPYFAFLLAETWSFDLILGYGDFDTRQRRALPVLVSAVPLFLSTIPVKSDFSSQRSFASTNVTNVSTFRNWTLTSSLGYLGSRRENDAYKESDGTDVAEANQSSKQWNFLGEVAYGRGNSEGFFGATYEAILDTEEVKFASGDQPSDDKNSAVLTAGWRHFGKDLTANFVLSRRVGQDEVRDYGFSMMLRMDL